MESSKRRQKKKKKKKKTLSNNSTTIAFQTSFSSVLLLLLVLSCFLPPFYDVVVGPVPPRPRRHPGVGECEKGREKEEEKREKGNTCSLCPFLGANVKTIDPPPRHLLRSSRAMQEGAIRSETLLRGKDRCLLCACERVSPFRGTDRKRGRQKERAPMWGRRLTRRRWRAFSLPS